MLDLPIAPRFTFPDQRIDAVRGSVAVERGPEVLCLESVDLPGGRSVDDFVVDVAVPPAEADGVVMAAGALHADDPAAWPYGPAGDWGRSTAARVALRPYHDWANRGPSTMRIWLRRE